MSLKVYTIHVKPSGKQDAGIDPDVILLAEGFSFTAFLLQGFWALYHRLWLVALAMFAASSAAQALARYLSGGAAIELTLSLAVAILIGAEARNLWRWTLERRGYRETGVVLGETLEDAERRYFDKAFSEADGKGLQGVEP